MKHRIICLAGLMAFCLATFAQQYQMEVKTTDGNITSYLMSSVNDVVYENGKTIINMNGSAKKEYDNREIVNISWKEFNGAISDDTDCYKTKIHTHLKRLKTRQEQMGVL